MQHVHIVLADDDADDCLIFSQVAAEVSTSVKITCLNDCESLIEFLQTTSTLPDIVFLDLNMPRLSGQDCLKKIKQNAAWLNIPIVIYSTASRKNIIDECYSIGASLYVVKPSNSDKLKETITWIVAKFVRAPNSQDS